MSARHGGRHSTIVRCRSATSTSTRTSSRTPSGTLPRHHRCTRATSVSGRTLTRLVCNPSRCDVHWNPPDDPGAKSLDETHPDQPPQSPHEWERWWLSIIKRAIAADYLTHHGRGGAGRKPNPPGTHLMPPQPAGSPWHETRTRNALTAHLSRVRGNPLARF